MLAITRTVALVGLDGHIVEVEVDVSNGLPMFRIVGLPDTAVREAKERVRASLKNSGFEFPLKRITVNLAPADVKKEGAAYDLPIAIGVLAASGQINPRQCGNFLYLGELSLDGAIRKVPGVLPGVMSGLEHGYNEIIVPLDNAAEASLIQNARVYPATTLSELATFLLDGSSINPYKVGTSSPEDAGCAKNDLADVKGQRPAKRALEIAAAGGHNLVMIGSPGSGKTLLAKCIPGIMPNMTFEEALEVTKIHSLCGLLAPESGLVKTRPFCSPHHSSTTAGMIGGGRHPRPGEITLAHNGVLFLDELPEFKKDIIEVLRQPLEDNSVTISRLSSTVTFPARFQLVAAMNPCPCGFLGDDSRECSCTPYQIQRYIGKISGPLLDRIDLHVEVPRIKYKELSDNSKSVSSKVVKERIESAREVQYDRQGKCNAHLSPGEIPSYCQLNRSSISLMKNIFDNLNLTARSYHRILKTARTIADLEGIKNITEDHIAEATQYRVLDRKYWG
ncbi:MAG TPA: YifB family Mg chelatase-like AAA ATPase [Clostridia bacterium]|nr:YifB family Mg chelatase-like AAA ATPase [Clostridia bacterium]